MGYFCQLGAGPPLPEPSEREVRREGLTRSQRCSYACRKGRVNAPERVHAVADAEPQNPRRSALWKQSQSLKRDIERRLVYKLCKRDSHPLFENGVGVSEKVQGQVHAIRTHP
jgi:hypothetical protein